MSHLPFYLPWGIHSLVGQGGQPVISTSDLGLMDFISGALATPTYAFRLS